MLPGQWHLKRLPSVCMPVKMQTLFCFRCPGSILGTTLDRKSTRLNSSHSQISYAVFCLKKKKIQVHGQRVPHSPKHPALPPRPSSPLGEHVRALDQAPIDVTTPLPEQLKPT